MTYTLVARRVDTSNVLVTNAQVNDHKVKEGINAMPRQQKVREVSRAKSAAQPAPAQTSVQPAPQQTQTAVQRITPSFPAWPSSKPGPQSTPVPPGMRPINAIRREQVAEAGYNQELGEPSTLSPFRSMPDARITEHPGFDQAETAQEALHRRKRRIEE